MCIPHCLPYLCNCNNTQGKQWVTDKNGALGWIDQRHPMGCFCLAGSPLCGSGQACWSKLVEQWFSPSSFPRYKKTPLHAVRFCVYGALGWIRTTDRSVRSRVLYPAELRVHWGLFSEDATIGEAWV